MFPLYGPSLYVFGLFNPLTGGSFNRSVLSSSSTGDSNMGAHGINIFDEDHACDWLSDLCDHDDPKEFFRECLNLSDADEYLEVMQCAGVLGTSVIIDGILNGSAKELPEEAVEWIAEHKNLSVQRLVPKAISGLDAVLGEESELNDLWKENEELYPEWRRQIEELKERLVAAS